MLLLLSALAWATPTLYPPSVPATGHQEAEVEVTDFGRYAIEVRSPRGTSVRLVDKMTGPGPSSGSAGSADGRLDVFLERGRSKLWLTSDPSGEGEVTLSATPFAELHGSALPLLLPQRDEATTLGDKEQRSWWIDVPVRQRLDLESAARHLGDLRLWQDGTWLHPATADCQAFEPLEGQPWTRCQLSTVVEPGLYRVTAYGAPSRPWTEASDARPFWLRLGVPVLGSPSEQSIELDAKGYARFRVTTSDARQARLALPSNTANASIGFARGTEGFRSGHNWAYITDESRTPETSVTMSGNGELWVKGQPGQRAILQVLPSTSWSRPVDAGAHLLTTVVGAASADTLDPTAVLVNNDNPRGEYNLRGSYALPLDDGRRYERRFNLLSEATMLVDVPSAGEWAFALEGDARLRVEPLMFNRPQGYQQPDLQSGGAEFDLEAGLYVVSLVPTKPGIVTLQMAPNTWGRAARTLIGGDLPLMRDVRTKVQDLDLQGQRGDILVMFGAKGNALGTSLRRLPATIEQPVSLTIDAKETVSLPIETTADGVVKASSSRGEPLLLRMDEGAWTEQLRLRAPGVHTIEIANASEASVRASVAWTPATHLPSTPPPPLTPERLAAVPDFEDVSEGAPAFLDLAPEEVRTFDVSVEEPGLYALTSTGLLATKGDLRTRVRTQFDSGDRNGVGRNFLVDRYLGRGSYQLSVRTHGASAGHLGVALSRAELREGGPLLDGEPARATVAIGDAVVYSLDVPEVGSYVIESVGLGRTFTCRIEDADGYPITSPAEQTCQRELTLRPGTYRVITAPERTESRRLTRAYRRSETQAPEGHGPHALRLDVTESGTWLEPSDRSAPRPPDVWTFALPAEASVTIHLDDAMTGTLHGPAGEVGRLLPGQPLEQVLSAGEYRIDVRAARRDHGLTYTLRVAPWELLSGVERTVSAPAEVPVAIGGNGSLTLASFGMSDVRAALMDGDGEIIARSDDRPDDWNFRIEERVQPGSYTLRVDPVGSRSARTQVRLVQPPEVLQPAITSGKAIDILPGTSVHTFPVERRAGEVVLAYATSSESLGMSIEVSEGGIWRTLVTGTGRDLALPAWPGDGEVRIRLWSLDPRGATARLTAITRGPQRVREASLATGLRAGGKAPLSPISAQVAPGVFTLSQRRKVWQCNASGSCARVEASQVAATADGLRLFVGESLKAERVTVEPGDAATVLVDGHGDRAVNLAKHSGLVAVVAHARAGIPVVRLHQKPSFPEGDFGNVGLAERATIAVASGSDANFALLRSTDGAPLEARLSTHHFTPDKPVTLGEQSLVELALDPSGASTVRLDRGPHELYLTLDAGVAVALVTRGTVDRVVWADAAPRNFTVITDAQEAWVLNVGGSEGAMARVRRAEAQLADRVVDELAASWSSPDQSTRVLTVAPGGSIRLEGGNGRLLDHDGHIAVLTGEVRVEDGATAWVDADPGVGALHKRQSDAKTEKRARKIDPGTFPLEGPEVQLMLSGEGLLELGLDEPAEVLVHGEQPRRVLLPAGGWVRQVTTAPLPVTIRALAGRKLGGRATLRVSRPEPIGEGVGPQVLLGPGEARAFAFDVPRDGPIGLGVQATADRVEATLYRGSEVLGTGLVQMTDVTEGAYVLVLHLPSDTTPVRARPVLTGITPPDSGPPDEVVRRYLELASEAP